MNYVNNKKEQCFIETHIADNLDFKQQCDGSTVTYFEDFTKNHNKTLIYFEAVAFSFNGGGIGTESTYNGATSPLPPIMATVIIETRDGKTIERPIRFVNVLPYLSVAVRTFQAENVCRVSLRCDCGGVGTTTICGFFDIVKTFCICCPDGKD